MGDPAPGDPYEGAEGAPSYADQTCGSGLYDDEPLSMQFERLYHSPDAER